jgi:transcriptional regulator with XRE-family HTH domain
MSALTAYIREAMLAKGWNQRALAAHAKVADSTISNLFNNPNYRGPSKATLIRIAQALDLKQRTLLELAGYVINESASDEQRTRRLGQIAAAIPRLAALTEGLDQISPEAQDDVLSLAELALSRHRKQGNPARIAPVLLPTFQALPETE